MSGYIINKNVTIASNPSEFTGQLAQLHRASQSPNTGFDFHMPTCDGDRAHAVDCQDSWAVFSTNMLLAMCDLDIRRDGLWPGYERAVQQVT